MTLPTRSDRHHCWCPRYDSAGIGPHRFDPNRCEPGYDSLTIFNEQQEEQQPDPEPVKKNKPTLKELRRRKMDKISGWICPFCGSENSLGRKRCHWCGK